MYSCPCCQSGDLPVITPEISVAIVTSRDQSESTLTVLGEQVRGMVWGRRVGKHFVLEQSSRYPTQKGLWQVKYLAVKTYSVQFAELPQNRHMPHKTWPGRRHAWHELLVAHFGQSVTSAWLCHPPLAASVTARFPGQLPPVLQRAVGEHFQPAPLAEQQALGKKPQKQGNVSLFSDPYHSGGKLTTYLRSAQI